MLMRRPRKARPHRPIGISRIGEIHVADRLIAEPVFPRLIYTSIDSIPAEHGMGHASRCWFRTGYPCRLLTFINKNPIVIDRMHPMRHRFMLPDSNEKS